MELAIVPLEYSLVMCNAEAEAKKSCPNCKVAKASNGAGIMVSKPLSPLALALMPKTQLSAMVVRIPARNRPLKDLMPKYLVASARVAAINAPVDGPELFSLIASELICSSPSLRFRRRIPPCLVSIGCMRIPAIRASGSAREAHSLGGRQRRLLLEVKVRKFE